METFHRLLRKYFLRLWSPLAGDINRMETAQSPASWWIPPEVPTRWGHQSNGNKSSLTYLTLLSVPTRWGHQSNGNTVGEFVLKGTKHGLTVPTRWGHQSNGNSEGLRLNSYRCPVPTRWGHQSNGNEYVFNSFVTEKFESPLAGDINRMETSPIATLLWLPVSCPSPLAGDINRMETSRGKRTVD
jgi:hypothetical protein